MMKNKKVGQYLINFNKKRGSGSFGKVYEGLKGNKAYAIKVVCKNNPDIPLSVIEQSVGRQLANLIKLYGVNIVFLYEFIETKHNYYLIFQLCETTLEELISPNMTQQVCIAYIVQIINGYSCFYQNKILHRDLKPGNILVKKGILKIADLGNSKDKKKEMGQQSQNMGTPGYIAPEVQEQDCRYNYKADIWSIGVIFYRMLHNKLPTIRQGQWIREDLSEHTRDFLIKCLETDPKKRISFEQITKHKIFNNLPIESGYSKLIISEAKKNLKPQETIQSELNQIKKDFISKQQFSNVLKKILTCTIDETKLKIIYDDFKDNDGQVEMDKVRKVFSHQKDPKIKIDGEIEEN